MPGSDFLMPGGHPRANLSIGMGLIVGKLQRVPIGNELTLSYTYENAGTHGFWHANQGAHTEALGIMRNYALKGPFGMYTWQQIGLTSVTGGPKGVQNRYYNAESLGLAYHVTAHHGIWLQGTANKIVTAPWYSTVSAGYTVSW